MSALGNSPTLDAYQLRLPAFEGPLDVLLRLIEREQLDISEVSLLLVLDQFMAFMRRMSEPPPNVIAEFAAVAGRLSVLKSRALLPRPVTSVEDPDESDLVRQLEEYRALKQAAGYLAERQRQGAGGFARGESIAFPGPEAPRIVIQRPSAIAKAMSRWMTRLPSRPIPIPAIRAITLPEMISRIFAALDREQAMPFDRVRAGCTSRQDLAVAFLSVLTLVRRQAITATQHELFGTITLARTSSGASSGAWKESTSVEAADERERLPA